MPDFMEARYEKVPSIVDRQIGGEVVLVPIRKDASEMDSIYTLEDVGAAIWGWIDGQRTVGQIRGLLLEEYDVTPNVVDADLTEFLRDLEAIGAIKAV